MSQKSPLCDPFQKLSAKFSFLNMALMNGLVELEAFGNDNWNVP